MAYKIEKNYYQGLTKITLTYGGLKASFLNYGARMYQLYIPDRNGQLGNILLSYDEPADILNDPAYFGAVVGPVAGRIKAGLWDNYQLDQNNEANHIHGGRNGWSFQNWEYQIVEHQASVEVIFSLYDTKSGYPGPIDVLVSYHLNENSLTMTTSCTTDSRTLVNPTSHSYFNLSGDGQGDILEHQLQIKAKEILAVDQAKIPTGKILLVKGTPYDFQQLKPLKKSLDCLPAGIDDTFVLNGELNQPQLYLYEPTSGRELAVATTAESMVLFSTTGFVEDFKLNGRRMHSNYGLAIEPQLFPDKVHHPQWGSIELTPGKTFTSQTDYYFSVKK